MITKTAHAKLNLYLHITGKREDGYHLLDSLFVFTDFGDIVTISPSDTLTLEIDGPYQAALSDCPNEKNLAYRAALLLKETYQISTGAKIQLTKNIPVCAGVGGGSADAAAVIKALNQLWQLNLPNTDMENIGLSLGADVPACLYHQPLLVSGIGEQLKPTNLPIENYVILMVNPNLPLATADVFRKLSFQSNNKTQNNPPLTSKITKDNNTLLAFLKIQKNDLEASAIGLMPEIQEILAALNTQSDCLLARMSGSGPTCFGLFSSKNNALAVENIIRARFPSYWTCVSNVLVNH